MKKIINIGLIIAITLMMTACNSTINEFDVAVSNTEAADSFRVDVTMENVPFFGTVSGYILVSGSEYYSTIFGMEQYRLTHNGREFELLEFNDTYYANEIPAEDEEELSLLYDEFDAEHFTINEEGYYVSDINYEEMSNVKVKLFEGYIKELSANMESDGSVYDITMEFSGYNSTTIDFPEYEFIDSTILTLLMFDDSFYDYEEITNGFIISDWSVSIEYIYGTDYYTIDQGYGDAIYYYPETELVQVGTEESQTVEEYLDSVFYTSLDIDIFYLLSALHHTLDE